MGAQGAADAAAGGAPGGEVDEEGGGEVGVGAVGGEPGDVGGVGLAAGHGLVGAEVVGRHAEGGGEVGEGGEGGGFAREEREEVVAAGEVGVAVDEEADAAEVGGEDVLLFAGEHAHLLDRDLFLLQRFEVGVRHHALLDAGELLAGLGDELTGVGHGGVLLCGLWWGGGGRVSNECQTSARPH